jgi:molybdenum cofactor cytidylyltransferase
MSGPRDAGTLPVVEVPDPSLTGDRDPTVHGVVLAAGTSSRYGRSNKLLASVDDEPMVRRATRPLAASTLEAVTVVVGHDAERTLRAVSGVGVDVVMNQAYERGQSTTLAAGIEAAAAQSADAAVVGLGDMPYVASATVDGLIAAYAAGAGTALAAACDGRRGNPVLFDAAFFGPLRNVEGDVGGREVLLKSNDAALVETGDPGVLRDINRPEDL